MRSAISSCAVAIFFFLPFSALADVEACRALAGSKFEADGEGVDFDEINPEMAVPTCERAVQENPEDLPSQYRLARALAAAEEYERAFPIAKSASESGYANAYELMGWMSYTGNGMPKDMVASFANYSRAYELGLVQAAQSVAWFHLNGTGTPKDAARAAALYKEAADAGLAPAQYSYAEILWKGEGVGRDPSAAMLWYHEAAKERYTPALTRLALFLMNGEGIAQDDKQALSFAMIAANENDGYAAYLVGFSFEHGRGTEPDLAKAMAWYERSEELNNGSGGLALGRFLESGKVTAVDLERARALYKDAADQGYTEAQARYGKMLAFGLGGPRDLDEAKGWLQSSLEHPVAQYTLGFLDFQDASSVADYDKAIKLLKQAADANYLEAQWMLGNILESDQIPAELRSAETAYSYLELAADNDHRGAIFEVGRRQFGGKGTERDREAGLRLLEKAAELGEPLAAEFAAASKELLRVERELCASMIAMCNRGCKDEPDGSTIYNTRDGKLWFTEAGRLIPSAEAPDFGCPQ